MENTVLSFKQYLTEERMRHKGEDGEVRYLDHRGVWIGFMGGKVVATKKSKESVEKYLASLGADPKPTAKAEKPAVTKPQQKSKVADTSQQDEDENAPETPEKIEIPKFTIKTQHLPAFEEKIAKLNKTAEKLKAPPITFEYGERRLRERRNSYGESYEPKRYDEVQDVTVRGEPPKLNGWTFVGKREPIEGSSGILAKSMEGMHMPSRFHDDHDLTCEHCKKNARRVSTLVVKKGRKYMEVGRQCLKDFLGHDSPEKYAQWAATLGELGKMFGGDEDNWGGGGRVDPSYLTKDIVAASIRSIKDKGFVSKQYASESKTPTSYAVSQHFDPPPKPMGWQGSTASWYEQFKIPVTDEDRKEAEEAIEWMKKHPKAGKEEFWTNVSKLVQAEALGHKNFGFVAAGAMMHQKAIGELKKTKGVMDDLKKDEGLGTVDQKVRVKGELISIHAYQNDWGTKRIATVKTDSGHLVKMFTTGGQGLKKGDRVEINGKIGSVEPEQYANSPFKGMMVTTMARRATIETELTPEDADQHFHIGDKIKFRREGKNPGVGIITGKPVYGKFEVSPVSDKMAHMKTHVSFDDIIERV